MGYTDIYMVHIPEGIKNTEPVVAKPPVDPKPETPVDTATTTPVVVQKPETPTTKPTLQPLKYVVSVVDAADQSTPLPARVKLVGARDNVIVAHTPLGDVYFNLTLLMRNPRTIGFPLK